MLLLLLLAEANAKVPAFTVLGEGNPAATGGSMFWRPGISIPTGLPGHVAQHVTLAAWQGPGRATAVSASRSCSPRTAVRHTRWPRT
jgi:hypothetical protein